MKYLWWLFLWTMAGLIVWVVFMAVINIFLKGARKDYMPEIPDDCPGEEL